MNDIRVIIPVADANIQDFSLLVNELCGNYVPEDRVEEVYEDGEMVEKIIENPYKDILSPDFSNKITLVSHQEVPSFLDLIL